jgi:tetratricopeptide (TPR) repeat protein
VIPADEWLDRIRQAGAAQKKDLIENAPTGAAAAIQSRLTAALYVDLSAARDLAKTAWDLARARPHDQLARAYALRGSAHIAYVEGSYAHAAESYEEAARSFAALGEDLEAARTESSGLQSLILTSQYDRAHQWAAHAEAVFLKHGDVSRLARLDSNTGNIYFRQDRARDAVARYRRALDGFRTSGDAKDIAAVLSNLAVAHTNLGEFREALAAYGEAREHCRRHGLERLGAQADYNIAYLYFLRGDYAEARRLYQISRRHCQQTGDAYHLALCDLDEAEMSLELNLTHEGESLARSAAARFDQLGMRYERAKALVSLAVAGSQKGELSSADRILKHARELFVLENNQVWPALIDLLRAVLAFRGGRYPAASSLSSAAWKTLAGTQMPGRAAHCQILRGRLWLREGQVDRARATSRDALQRLGGDAPPSLRFHAKLLEGEAEEAQGRWSEALACFEAARREVEDLRGRLDTEDLRISILKDKLAVYEGLVSLHLEAPALAAKSGSVEQALLYVQQAKSRSLADRLLHIGAPAGERSAGGPGGQKIETLRQDLTWCYRQIELALLMERAGNPLAPVAALRSKARAIEAELLRLHSAAETARRTTAGDGLLQPAQSAGELSAAIPSGGVLLEYFECRGRLYLFLVSRKEIRLQPLGPIAPVRQSMKLLQFQLGKHRIHPGPAGMDAGLAATRHHLASLHASLLGPVSDYLRQFDHWIIAPHRHLHGIPFAALEKDGVCLQDRVDLLHTPSASVFAACRKRPPVSAEASSWVIAVPDEHNPDIEREAALVCAAIPGANAIIGTAATLSAFQSAASRCSILHLAAHGVFRRDNPMFSSIQLADGPLSLLDLSHTRLEAGLVTLSACNTGSAVSVGGDELLGLMRGFLAAGARNLLVSLWEVDDESTTRLMAEFYRHLIGHKRHPALALRKAAAEIRREQPHPYFWAPFILVGS